MATQKNQKNKKKADRLNTLEKKEAFEEMVDSAGDFLNLKITVPLGNPALKKVHTNQFLFTELPKEFPLKNWEKIAKAFNSEYNRYSNYMLNRWYVEGTTVDVDASGKGEMKIDLNTFATDNSDFSKSQKDSVKAYTDAKNKNDKNKNGTKTSSGKSKTNATTTGDNKTVKSGWWGKWVEEWVRKVVGNETDQLKKAKLIYEAFRSHVFYKYYCCAWRTHQGNVKYYESAYKNGHLNCGDGANIQCAMYNCAGINAVIMNTPNHFIVRMTIKGKYYWTDCAGLSGHHDNHGFNEVYGPKGGSKIGLKVTCPGPSC